MIARCARCQQTFTTQVFGVQRCPHCGTEIHLADPNAPGAPSAPAAPPSPPGTAAPPPPQQGWGAPPPPPPGAWGPTASPPPPPPGGWGPIPPGGVPPLPPASGESSPFAQRSRLGFFQAFAQTFKLVALEPARFFGQVKVNETGSALLFGVAAATVGTWVSVAFNLLFQTASLAVLNDYLRRMGGGSAEGFEWIQRVGMATIAVGSAVVAPIVHLLGIYIMAAIFHLVLILVRGGGRGFDATLTVVAYAYGLYLIGAVPMCGGLIALVWFLVAAIVGLAAAQRSTGWKAALAVFSPLILLCLCACGAAIAIPNMIRGVNVTTGGATNL